VRASRSWGESGWSRVTTWKLPLGLLLVEETLSESLFECMLASVFDAAGIDAISFSEKYNRLAQPYCRPKWCPRG
jgi:hypothetical protein